MFRYSIAEMMIVVVAVALAAGGIAMPAEEDRGEALGTALLLGFTVAGPPLLLWRRRAGTLTGRWGLGELAWFFLGLYFLPLVAGSAQRLLTKADADHWLVAGFVIAAAICAAAVILAVSRLFTRLLGQPAGSGRNWFDRRTTNLVGLAVLLIYTAGVGTLLVLQGRIPF